LLAAAFPDIEVYAANISQGAAFGAAIAMHNNWNKNPLPENLIKLKKFTAE
jgi:L-fuculokinase